MHLLVGCAGEQAQASMQPDPEIVSQLVGMGFSENGSKRAAVATQVGTAKTSSYPCELTWLSCLHTCLSSCLPGGSAPPQVYTLQTKQILRQDLYEIPC